MVNRMKKTILFLSLTFFIAGCFEEKIPDLPEVNDENCQVENIKKLHKKIQVEFGDKCATHSTFTPSKPVQW